MPVTMKDVAKKANLSLGTVSNYINGKASVKQANKEKIEQAIEALGYQVNELARFLKTKNSMTIGVIIPTFANVFAVRTISHLENIFRENDYSLQVCSYNNLETLEESIKTMMGKRVDGLIIMPGSVIGETEIADINSLINKQTPVIIFDSTNEGIKCDHVVLDNYEAIKNLTNRLFELGHKNIAFLLGPDDISSSAERLKGFKDAHKENGIEIKDDLIVHTDYTKGMSRDTCKELIGDDNKITAVLAAGYRITLGILSAFKEMELNVPDDISVVGFDVLDISDVLPYGLTGVHIPTTKVAKEISEIMLKRIINGFDDFPKKSGVEIEYIEGNSVKDIK